MKISYDSVFSRDMVSPKQSLDLCSYLHCRSSVKCFQWLMTAQCTKSLKVKVKFSHTRFRALGPELIPVYRQSARRWLEAIHPAVVCHYFPPGLRLPSQPKSVTTYRPVPNYTALWQRHMRVSSLPKAVTWKRTGRDSNPRPLGSRANALPLSHTGLINVTQENRE